MCQRPFWSYSRLAQLIGLVNGLIITKLHVNSFIATLGTSLIIKGIINATFSNYTGQRTAEFSIFWIRDCLVPSRFRSSFCCIIVIAGWFLLTRTKFGSHLYGVGGNVEVARLSGLRTDRVMIGAHILCSLTAVLTGLFLVSRLAIRRSLGWTGWPL